MTNDETSHYLNMLCSSNQLNTANMQIRTLRRDLQMWSMEKDKQMWSMEKDNLGSC